MFKITKTIRLKLFFVWFQTTVANTVSRLQFYHYHQSRGFYFHYTNVGISIFNQDYHFILVFSCRNNKAKHTLNHESYSLLGKYIGLKKKTINHFSVKRF